MTQESVSIPAWSPPKWLNAMMRIMLSTPGLQRILGRTTALITFTGRRTGNSYTTPVTYYRSGDEVVVLSRHSRLWWRNLEAHPDVVLRLAGRTFQGYARATVGDDSTLANLVTFLENRHLDAKAYGVTFEPSGRVNVEEVRALLPHVVVVEIALEPQGFRRD